MRLLARNVSVMSTTTELDPARIGAPTVWASEDYDGDFDFDLDVDDDDDDEDEDDDDDEDEDEDDDDDDVGEDVEVADEE